MQEEKREYKKPEEQKKNCRRDKTRGKRRSKNKRIKT